ncbi:hypothetical protein OESDEN_05553 [Oesophagostomum dentatum]|uniref:Uncharacterized protein n=1 Tax=Oesophagostomum dentatum TaxID=61180 RepID=A0A0B1TAC9_OESDE|nr:hypothetical protein OESDEN_05553 [Oesophagostomum dentatum]
MKEKIIKQQRLKKNRIKRNCSDNVSLESSSSSSVGLLARRKPAVAVVNAQLAKVQRLPLIDNSIDKPRTVKSLSAGQTTRNLPTSTSCTLPKIGGSGQGRRVTISESNHRRANSSGSVDRRRTGRTQEGLSVRSASLRPISDPLLDVLAQIHKIVMISDAAVKSLSAGQTARNLPTSTSCTLPKIGGSGQGRRVTISESNHRRANSSGSVDRRRAGKTQEGLSVRSASLRPISDPLLDVLAQIHKIVMISDAAPSESMNHKRRVVEQFRRRIFGKSSNADMIKKHLRKNLYSCRGMFAAGLEGHSRDYCSAHKVVSREFS